MASARFRLTLLTLVAVAAVLIWGTPASATVTALTDTSITEAQFSALFPGPPALETIVGNLPDPTNPTGTNGDGGLQSAAYLGVGAAANLYAYVYQVECQTGADWDVDRITIPMGGAVPVAVDFGTGSATSFEVTSPVGVDPYTQALVNFNADAPPGLNFGVDPTADPITFALYADPAQGNSVGFGDWNGFVFVQSGAFGFVTNVAPALVTATYADAVPLFIGSATVVGPNTAFGQPAPDPLPALPAAEPIPEPGTLLLLGSGLVGLGVWGRKKVNRIKE